jgi:hypothetical protein
MMTNKAIEAPADHHAELGFMPPLHAASAVCLNLGRFLLSLARFCYGGSFFSRAVYTAARRRKRSSRPDQEKGIASGNLVF